MTLQGVLVHLLARDAVLVGHVLGRLAHAHVGLGQPLPVPGEQPGVVRFRLVGEYAEGRAGTGLDPDAHEGGALIGLDGVESHPDGLQRRRAVAVDRGTWSADPGQDADDPSQVVPLLAAGKGAAADHVVDLAAVQLRDLLEHLVHDIGAQVVRPLIDERALDGAADRCPADRGDNDF